MPFEPPKIRKLFQSLRGASRFAFPRRRERIQAPDKHGVYIIFSPRGAVLHVGRTLRGKRGLRQRLKNHLHGSSSFTIQYLKGKGSRLRSGYEFSFIEISDARTRALLEAYAVGRLCPKHLGVGESAA
ncbi:MAG TPA: GIY-YIG nuclease family protein [Gemmatimonadaceae bacterium]|nr:GIY-YIG nuclease family protein [Gemmatimonadaceae bacterium]